MWEAKHVEKAYAGFSHELEVSESLYLSKFEVHQSYMVL